MDIASPLDNFPVVQTHDAEEAWHALSKVYVRPTVATIGPTGNFRAAINECRLQSVRISYSTYGTPLRFAFPNADCFVHMMPLAGSGELSTRNGALPLSTDIGATVSPDNGFESALSEDFECLYLKIDKQALTHKLIAMTGATVNEPLLVDPRLDPALPVAKVFHQYIPVLVETLSSADLPLPPWWVAQTEQLLMVMFLCAHQHNYSHLLEGGSAEAAPAQIRRAEEYIEANWQRAITLEELAEVSGVSAFSLFRSFKAMRGYSPLEFLDEVRARHGGVA